VVRRLSGTLVSVVAPVGTLVYGINTGTADRVAKWDLEKENPIKPGIIFPKRSFYTEKIYV